MPAMSHLGTVGCLPGRTIAFRRTVLLGCMDRFTSEKFLGVYMEISDDRTLTNFTLQAGYRTVYQSTSVVYTDAPETARQMVKQQYRWARGSQYNTMRMMPWMLSHARFLALFYALDILVPFVLIGNTLGWLEAVLIHSGRGSVYTVVSMPGPPAVSGLFIVLLAVALSSLSLSFRFSRHFSFRPVDLYYLPMFMLINVCLLLPIRMWGFFRCGHNSGWATRADSFQGTKSHSPLTAIPYLIGTLLLATTVLTSII